MNGSGFRYFVVDAFTNRPFQGNPAAVVPLDHWKEDAWLQSVAMEMNLSETAFLVPNSQGFDLRWFTPTTEVDLCGHATIASSVVLVQLGKLADGSEVVFSTRSGILGAKRKGSQIQLDFPALPAKPCEPPTGILESLKVQPRFVGRSTFDVLVCEFQNLPKEAWEVEEPMTARSEICTAAPERFRGTRRLRSRAHRGEMSTALSRRRHRGGTSSHDSATTAPNAQ